MVRYPFKSGFASNYVCANVWDNINLKKANLLK